MILHNMSTVLIAPTTADIQRSTYARSNPKGVACANSFSSCDSPCGDQNCYFHFMGIGKLKHRGVKGVASLAEGLTDAEGPSSSNKQNVVP